VKRKPNVSRLASSRYATDKRAPGHARRPEKCWYLFWPHIGRALIIRLGAAVERPAARVVQNWSVAGRQMACSMGFGAGRVDLVLQHLQLA
jgi:hypothetical protein